MTVLRLAEVTFGFGTPPQLENVTLNIEAGERVGLLGRNGVGKSTLLRLIAGELRPESGSLSLQPGARAAYLTQDVPDGLSGTVFDRVADGLGPIGAAIADYHRLHRQADPDHTALDAAVHRLGEQHAWEKLHQVERILGDMGLDGDRLFDDLSAGRKRRVLLAGALVGKPEILLLDEPTNHLDIDSIVWLQDYLLRFEGTVVFITHDRTFLQALATRVVELDRGRLFNFKGSYANFLRHRDELLEGEARQEAIFDKKLAQEEVWLRRGIKARRTRNEGRVRALMQMRQERAQRRKQSGALKMTLQEGERSGARVVKAEEVSFSYGDRVILKSFSTEIMRGDRIGLIGPNGAGKTTLLRILLGQLEPQSGTVKLGTQLAVSYFDQLRRELDETKTVKESVVDGNETVEVNGVSRHVLSYLEDFLFTPDRARMGVAMLSGGERNRLLLARMFTRPSNVLVLDEPTNDLDAETLDLLEEVLADYAGTVFLVSHDRTFLNNVVTSTIAVEGNGNVREYAGGYDDYLRQRPASPPPPPAAVPIRRAAATTSAPTAAGPRKLSFKEKRELEELPGRIEALEARQKELHQRMAEPGYHRQGADRINAAAAELEQVGRDLEQAYARWGTLES
ncbi:MAG TPA: ATP-binding cassette domain-containing protein [Planctomycetota bacterium]|nr:ATP-binding cassette domain-containing protein [Planctomycetota bacterium]